MMRHFRALAGLLVLALVLAAAPAGAVDIRRVVSPGGIEAWLVEDRLAPIISLELAVCGGAATDPTGKEGLAELVASTLDEGAGDLDSQAFQSRLEDLSISLSFSADQDAMRGSLRTLSRNRDEAFRLLGLALASPRFDVRSVERVRAQLLTRLARNLQDPGYIAGRALWGRLFPGHPYGRPHDGTPDTLRAITAEDLRAFVPRRFARDALIIGVVGDIGADALGTLLDRTFAALPKSAPAYLLPDVAPLTDGRTHVVEHATPQSTILFAQPGLRRSDPDWYAATVLNYILGGGSFSSRLYSEVREKRGLAYSVYSYLAPLGFSAVWAGGAATANAAVGESVTVIRSVWYDVAAGGIGAEELADAKRYITGSWPLRFTDTAAIAATLVAVQIEGLGIDYIDRRNALVGAVSADDVARVARRVLDPEKLTIVVVGRPDGLK
ncbi:MAG: insulinase family protein [Alphaproteobacteria bacterium]|nr:insulinase family protein [Alphaproteobacteria bacterium]